MYMQHPNHLLVYGLGLQWVESHVVFSESVSSTAVSSDGSCWSLSVSFLIPALFTVTSQSHNVCMYSRDLIATLFI